MTKLYIENYEIDLTEGLSNSITYAVDDIVNIDSKMTSFSKTIVLPGTGNNNNILGNIYDLNNANFTGVGQNIFYNFNASRLARCRIEVNGLQIIKGTLRLLRIIKDRNNYEYEVAVFGELGGFISALSNSKLEDLDFSAYDHTYSLANITASWDDWNQGYGYYYPLIDYGLVSTDKHDFQYTAFRPALFLKEYLEKIIANAGYTYESNFFSTNFFKRLIIPHNQKALRGNVETNYVTATRSTNQVFSAEPDHLVTFTSNTLNNFTLVDGYKYRHDGATTITTKCILNIQGNYYTPPGATLRILIQKYGVNFEQQEVSLPRVTGSTAFNINLELTTDFALNDYVIVKLNGSFSFFWFPSGTITSANFVVDKDPAGFIELLLDDEIAINTTIPRGIFQKDFFTSCLKAFNLIVTEDKYKEKHLVIEPYIDFNDVTPSSYLDWSGLVDRSKPIISEPMSNINARFYNYAYKQDRDYYNELYRKTYNQGYGDNLFDNGFEFVKETEKVELIFSSTPLVGYDSEDKILPTIFKLASTTEEQVDSNIRIMQGKKITGVSSWDILNGVSVLGSYTDYPYAGHLDDPDAPNADINFGVPSELYFTLATGNLTNNLFNTYYSPYMAEIVDKDSRLVTCYVKLNEIDIFNLDFSKFIYIDGGLYRLIKVVDFVAGGYDNTKVELLRVIKTLY